MNNNKKMEIFDNLKFNESSLVMGMESNEKDFVCYICGSHLGSSAYNYKQHMKMEHDIDVIGVPKDGNEFKE